MEKEHSVSTLEECNVSLPARISAASTHSSSAACSKTGGNLETVIIVHKMLGTITAWLFCNTQDSVSSGSTSTDTDSEPNAAVLDETSESNDGIQVCIHV